MIWLKGITRQIALETEDGTSSYSAKGYFRYFYSKNCFSFSGQGVLLLQVDASKGFRPYLAFYHKVHDHLLYNNLHASTHKLDRFTCCAQGKQYKCNRF